MATETVAKPRTSARVGVQKFGTFLSGMIMPNIGAFIAWGLITALFIEKGWIPVPTLGGYGTNEAGIRDTFGIRAEATELGYRNPALFDEQGGDEAPGDEGANVGHDHAGQECSELLDANAQAGAGLRNGLCCHVNS